MARSADLLANLYVVLAVQHPGGEFLLRGAWYAPQTFRVKGQAHDGLRVGFDLAQHGPQGYIPQQQRTILISSQQERSDTWVWLEEEGNIEGRRRDSGIGRGNMKKQCEWRCERRVLLWSHRNHRLVLEAERSRGYHPGSSGWHSRDAVGSIHQPVALSVQNTITPPLTLLLIYIPETQTL